jgi:hypothetical protein
MIKRSLTLIACGAKALALIVGVLAATPSSANADGDCWWCAPDTGMCYPDEPCWDEC